MSYQIRDDVGAGVLQKCQRLLPWLLMLTFWTLSYGATVYGSALGALDPELMSDDVRIVHIHFFNWMDPSLFANDILGKYHSDGTGELFRALFYVAAKLWDPYTFTKLPPYLLYAVTLLGLAVAAHRLGGRTAAFIVVTLCLGASMMLGRMVGLLPRAFAYPILAWMAVALTHGRVRLLACLTVIGAGLYPVLTVIGGLALAVVLLLQPAEDRGEAANWKLKKRLLWVAGTALAGALVMLPFTLRMAQYGETITPALIADYPEAGPGGRQDSVTRPPFAPLSKSWAATAKQSVLASGPRLVPLAGEAVENDSELRETLFDWLTFGTVMGCALLGLGRNRAMRGLAVLALAIGVGYLLANAVTPRLVVPPRYTLYGVPIVTVLALSAAPSGLMSVLPKTSRIWSYLRGYGAFALGALLLALVGGKGAVNVGLRRYNTHSDRPLLSAVADLPPSSLIAGWPEGILETLPILSRRTPFLTRELHVPYHTSMTLQMRDRMKALILAYYATDVAPLRRLRDEFGVTHLLVEPSRYVKPSRYFAPFRPDITRAFQQGSERGFAVDRLRDSAAIYGDGKYYVLELSRLPSS